MSDREETVKGLRELASFLEAHPEVPAPYLRQIDGFISREQAASVARVNGGWEKIWQENWFVLRRRFSEKVALDLNVDRGEMCWRVQTGTRHVDATPAREEPIYEWVCEDTSLLAGAK